MASLHPARISSNMSCQTPPATTSVQNMYIPSSLMDERRVLNGIGYTSPAALLEGGGAVAKEASSGMRGMFKDSDKLV